MSILDVLDWLLFLAFTAVALWAFALSRRKAPEPVVANGKKKAKTPPLPATPPLPSRFYQSVNATHALYLIALLAEVVYAATSGKGLRGGVIEYVVLFVGGGVVYARGHLPGGWAWRALTREPKVARELFLASAWCATAVLGFIARSGARLW